MSSKVVRSIREPLKKPRPLKTTLSSDQIKDSKDVIFQKTREEILLDLETLNVGISNCSFDEYTAMDITRMCNILKKRGEELDLYHKEAVDRFYCTLRNASREERLNIVSRVKLLEAIEQRARGWKKVEKVDNYFNLKIKELEQKGSNASTVVSPTMPYPLQNQNISSPAVPLASGEILRSSGKFEKPTKIAGKNYYKDEIVIRNSDSGKVMGIKGRRVHMIEELSDTVISFQRVNPGARDRLVQITGPNEEAISHSKLLIEDTVRRNASPIRESPDLSNFDTGKDRDFGNSFSTLDNEPFLKKQLQHSFSMGDASLKEYNISLQIGDDFLTLTGTNAELLQTAKVVLKEYFAGQSRLQKQHENLNRQASPDSNFQRFDLMKQSSLRNSMESYSSWNNNLRRDSTSPFSSSDDDIIKETAEKGSNREFKPFDNNVGRLNVKSQGSFTPDSTTVPSKIRSSSLPADMMSPVDGLPESRSVTNDDVFSALVSDSSDPPIPPPSYQKKFKYSREFLMKCAKSPFSHNQPSDYARIHHNYREIVCQSPVMFDPEKHEQTWPPESPSADA